MRKLALFIKLSTTTKLLLIEAFFLLAWARKIKSMPFSKIAPSLGFQMQETPFIRDSEKLKIVRSVAQAVNIMSRYTFWESKCLVRAIAAMKMLERRNIESTLYLGTARENNGDLSAHAWLRSGHYYVTGAEEMKRFTVVAKFAKCMTLE